MLSDLITLYQTHNKEIGRRPATIRWHTGALDQFLHFTGNISTETVSTELIEQYRAHLVKRGLATESVNNYLRSLAALIRWATKRRLLAQAIEVEPLTPDPSAPKEPLTRDEFRSLLKATGQAETPLQQLRDRAIIMLLYDTGLRASELIATQWPSITETLIDGQTHHTLTIQGAKRGPVRLVPLTATVWAAISDYRQLLRQEKGLSPAPLFISSRSHKKPKPLTISGLQQLCYRLATRAGVSANPHKFRRSFATNWINSEDGDGDTETLKAIGGWNSTSTIYKHYARYQVRKLVKSHQKNSPLSQAI